MLKRCLLAISIMALVMSGASWAQIDKIGLFTEAVSWTDVATAQAAADYIMQNVKSANEIKVYSDADIGKFAQANTGDGNFDIIITFGYFPKSLYTPGNVEPDGSVGEKFLEGGDMFLNTADYIFYVTEGGGTNGDQGLKNMTNENFDMWTDNTRCKPTSDGKRYTPSIPDEYDAPRCFKTDQVEASANWVVEKVFGSNGATYADPIMIRNKVTGGRIAIAFQVGGTMPRAEVITEMIENYLKGTVAALNPSDKLPSAWGRIKSDL